MVTIEMIRMLLPYVCMAVVAAALVVWVVRLAQLLASSVRINRETTSLRSVDYRRFQESEHIMPVSLILPALDEDGDLNECVSNLLSLEFKRFEVIVIADSLNKTSWNSLKSEFGLIPFNQPYKKSLKSGFIVSIYRSVKDVRLIVLDQRGGSRAGALNAGVNLSSYPIIALTYPQLRLTNNALLKTVYAFVSDPACVCIGTLPRIGGKPEETLWERPSLLELEQGAERLKTLYTGRGGYKGLGFYLPLQTTFAAFLKSAVIESGGFSSESETEQADLLLRVHERQRLEKRDYSMRLLPDAVCFELPQNSLKSACSLAGRSYGACIAAIRKNAPAARRIPAVRRMRMQEIGWPLLGAGGLLVLLSSAALGAVSFWPAVFYLLTAALFGALLSAAAVLVEENAYRLQTDTELLIRKYWAAVVNNFGYRLCGTLAKIFARRK